MKKRASKKPVTDVPVIAAYDPELGIDAQLRAAMRDSRKSRYAIAQESGISQSILSRFGSGERGLTAETAERLAVALGLRLCLVSPMAELFGGFMDECFAKHPPTDSGIEGLLTDVVNSKVMAHEVVRVTIGGLAKHSPLPPYVSLLDLRSKLAEMLSRKELDACIQWMRSHGMITLSVAENRHPMTAAERDACIVIDGEQYALISLVPRREWPSSML